MRNAIDYTGRLLIIEAPDSDWTNDRMPDDFADLIGVRTKLRVLQSEYGDLDLVLRFFLTKKTQCRQSLPDDFMCFYGMQFMHKQFMFSILYIHIFLFLFV